MKKGFWYVSATAVLLMVLSGCGAQNAASTTASAPAAATASPAPAATAAATATPAASAQAADTASVQPQNVYMVIEAGAKLAPDGKLHDAYINGDIKITKGQKVTLHILNYDDGKHTYTVPDLGLNVDVAGSTKKGEPAETAYTFTPDKEGTFQWLCADKCDGQNGQYAMVNDGYMKGKITVLPETNKTQYVSLVINAGYKLGSDGKMHDAYTPGDFTVNHGQPVELTIYNFDDGQHTLTSADLNVNLAVAGSKKKGEPSVSTLTFTPDKAGTFQWLCAVPCDGEAGAWAMAQDNYMMGKITVN